MRCYLRHQRTGESLGGVLVFFPWVCISQNATQFLEGDLEKVLLLDENNFSIPVSGLSTASDAEDRLSLTFSFAYSLANAEINSLATIFLPI